MSTAPISNSPDSTSELEVIEVDALGFAVGRIRFLCSKRGLSWAELARRALMDEGKVGKVMRGERGLRFDEGLRMCYVLDIKVGDLLIPPELMRKLVEANRWDEADVVPRVRRGGRAW